SYLLFLMVQQASVYYGVIDTYKNGESIAATVTDFDIKQIAAQSNGYVVIEFRDPKNGETIERKLSLSVQMAQKIIDTQIIPIRYEEGAEYEIVLIPVFEMQKTTTLLNFAVATLGFIALCVGAIYVTRFANKNARTGGEQIQIERVDL
ncbi:MAG TPA: hypothetical protein DEQ34_13800, partial [Balneolaceae bacterium]|nr:hypothetical protein [Balneolaceae bacterium]